MKNAAIIPNSLEEKDALITALLEENASLKQRYEHLLEQFKLSKQRHFSSSSESTEQLSLQFDEAEAIPTDTLPAEENGFVAENFRLW